MKQLFDHGSMIEVAQVGRKVERQPRWPSKRDAIEALLDMGCLDNSCLSQSHTVDRADVAAVSDREMELSGTPHTPQATQLPSGGPGDKTRRIGHTQCRHSGLERVGR
ncbi:MAG: hypothetical protein WCO88_02780 [Actinomycetota bacterium]